jgi:hypothetical protein
MFAVKSCSKSLRSLKEVADEDISSPYHCGNKPKAVSELNRSFLSDSLRYMLDSIILDTPDQRKVTLYASVICVTSHGVGDIAPNQSDTKVISR